MKVKIDNGGIMSLGLTGFEWTVIFQIINTVALLVIVIGIPYYIIRKLKKIDNRLKSIEELIKKQNHID